MARNTKQFQQPDYSKKLELKSPLSNYTLKPLIKIITHPIPQSYPLTKNIIILKIQYLKIISHLPTLFPRITIKILKNLKRIPKKCAFILPTIDLDY